MRRRARDLPLVIVFAIALPAGPTGSGGSRRGVRRATHQLQPADDQLLLLQLLLDQELLLQELLLHELLLHELPDQLLLDQELLDHELPLQELLDQLLLPQLLPFQVPPDHDVPAASAAVRAAASNGCPKMSMLPRSATPPRLTWAVPRACSSEPVPVESA